MCGVVWLCVAWAGAPVCVCCLTTRAAVGVQVVGSGAITKEEFWRQRQQALLNEQHARPKVGFTPAAGSGDGLQRRDTSTRVEFALDQYQMTKIFLESPAVFTAYLDLVPKRCGAAWCCGTGGQGSHSVVCVAWWVACWLRLVMCSAQVYEGRLLEAVRQPGCLWRAVALTV